MPKKIKIGTINIDHWFESKRDMEIYKMAHFPYIPNQDSPVKQSEPPKSPEPKTLWIGEAIAYLGLDRIGLKRPDKAVHRLIVKDGKKPRRG